MHDNPEIICPSIREYQSPALRIIPVHIENALCDSPVLGGLEDIYFEDWN